MVYTYRGYDVSRGTELVQAVRAEHTQVDYLIIRGKRGFRRPAVKTLAPGRTVGRPRVGSTTLPNVSRFCCASKMGTASEAREPDAYRDSSNRLLGCTWPGTPPVNRNADS